MMNIEAEFDNLVHAVVTKVNEVLADNCDPKSGYLCNDDGTPMQLFLKGSYTPYEKITDKNEIQAAKDSGAKLYEIYDENGNGTRTYWKYVEEYDASDPDSRKNLYNCANLKINQELVQTPSKLGFVKEDGSTDYSLGKQLLKAFEDAEIYINPNATKASSFENCYTEIVNQMSTMGNVFKDVYEYQQLAVEQAESNRQSVIGVSSDEELEHMIQERKQRTAKIGEKHYVQAVQGMGEFCLETICPIISGGDVTGAVLLLEKEEKKNPELDEKMAQGAADFLGRQMG